MRAIVYCLIAQALALAFLLPILRTGKEADRE